MANTTVAIPLRVWETQLKTLGQRCTESLRVLLRNRLATLGLILVFVTCVTALLAPSLATHDPLAMNLPNRLLGPSSEHFLGTDIYGRDIYTRIVFGARIAMRVAFGAVLLAVVIGVPLGAISGYAGGWLDTATMRLI
ncbi:MAG TPA: hypothetical protein VLJ79_21820, partial [Candidatus Binatia bacterium]|nr:hypothetical protein [Candidatus Binatia bacterium]